MPNLPTFRDVVQLRLRNMSPRKAYASGSADLQLELSRNYWEKSSRGRKKWDKFRRESPDCSSPYFNPGSIWKVTPPATQHCFKSGDTIGSLGCFQTAEFTFTKDLCPLECRNLKEDLKYLRFWKCFGWNGEQRKPSSSSKLFPSEKAAQWDGRTKSEPQSLIIKVILQNNCS